MAAEEDIVKITFAHLEKIVKSSNLGMQESKARQDKRSESQRQQRSKRPEQQIYRPGQLRHTKSGKPGRKSDDGSREEEGLAASNYDDADHFDTEDLKLNVTDEDKGQKSRESSGDINFDDVNQRLDNLYIESPPREIKQESSEAPESESPDDKASRDKRSGGGNRRGKRPDIRIYVPRARLGDRERRSEEKDEIVDSTAIKRDENKDEGDDQSEIVVTNVPDSLRKVQVKSKGGAMKVTVKNEPQTGAVSGNENSHNPPHRDTGHGQGKTSQQQKHNTRESPGSDVQGKQQGRKDNDHKNKNQPRNSEKFSRQFESRTHGRTRQDSVKSEMGTDDARKPFKKQPDRQPARTYYKNRRSSSSDSRPKEQRNSKMNSDEQPFSSETFPRAKGVTGKSTQVSVREINQSKNTKETLNGGKGNGREGEKFYWGMRRQRTGSISSEASYASNLSNGSYYSGSSDFTEDDEPEHILNWGEEVEKAHLEELARLVHDGTRKLTSSLDAYPGILSLDGSVVLAEQRMETTGLDRQKSVSADNVNQGKTKGSGRARHRRHRHRKNSSRQGSRDSSIHSSTHGDDVFSERGHRRRRKRLNSQGSQGGFQVQPRLGQKQHHLQHHDDQRSLESEAWGNRSGLQVTVGDNNRHVAISPSGSGGARLRHMSDEKWDPHYVSEYNVAEGEEDWDRGGDYGEDLKWNNSRHQRKDKEVNSGPKKDGTGIRSRRGSGRDDTHNKHAGSRDERNKADNQGEFIEDWDHVPDRREPILDQRAVNPAHDSSVGGNRASHRGGRSQGRNINQTGRKDSSGHDGRHQPVQRAGSLNHDDLTISQKSRGGLIQLPVQQEPPRPHSNPSASYHAEQVSHLNTTPQGSNTRGPSYGKRQLFDPKNPSKPIFIPEVIPPPPRFEETVSSPGAGSSPMPSSPENQPHPYPTPMFYPPEFMHPMYRFRPPFPPFMGGYSQPSIPPHIFYRFPRMAPPDMGFYNSCEVDAENLMSAASRTQCRLMAEQILRDSAPFDSQLGNILSRRPLSDDSLRMVNQIRAELQNRLEQIILMDIEVANKHNVEQTLWKSVYYQVIESHRKRLGEESQDVQSKQKLMDVLDEGSRFFENLLKKLQSIYGFDLDLFSDGNKLIPENVSRIVKLALLSAQRVMMFLGDIARYREQASDTTNYGKARHWYLKAQRIHPRNGRPYNQLAILAVYTRRKLDAVYYYMRSLAASNPILTARESLMSLFDEVRRKVDAAEKKRFEERRHRMALRRKPQRRGPRVEIWVLPDGTCTQDRVEEDEEDDLSSLSVFELNKRFVLTYLNVHGKLFTKINFEVFAESSSLMLQEFQILIQHSPCVFSCTRLLQLMVINMFSIDNTALKDESLEDSCRSVLQEHAVEIALDMFGLLVKRSCELLSAQIEAQKSSKSNEQQKDANSLMSENPLAPSKCEQTLADGSLSLDEDLHLMLPALKIWVDWMMCHPHLWNPQPFNRPPDLGPQIDVWKNLATFCDLLNEIETKQGCLIRESQEGFEPVILQEDTTLAGFVPMLSAPQEIFYADTQVDKELAEDWLRIEKLRLFGEYLCGVEPAMLAFNVESGKYYAVAPSPTRSEEKLVNKEENSGEESDGVIIEHDDSGDAAKKETNEKNNIELLKAKKAELSRQREEREKNKENMEAILDSHRHAKIELEICPIFLIPDTNCFIDHFSSVQKILQSKKYTLVVPLVVINELDGLARGARDKQYDSPDHAHMVKTQSQAAIDFLESEFEKKNPNLKALTAKGSTLETIAFRSEEPNNAGINDDIILNCCLHYCKDMAREFMPKDKDQPVRLYREVVLLTDDRNLRLKAHTCNIPVKDVPNFKRWSKIT
ncbi:telomerase-binding protein EST1A [Biomphalaria pfeifferi]|uniref:Telomerase-binding protein EST1A n=1 Tax=Biomphalaria pfeifferi TaxID=112525 RepID=A0AAD8BQG7_BIOPF|nr:telomerase-binding protein EST1A [Biomphalaria pfeifferi]